MNFQAAELEQCCCLLSFDCNYYARSKCTV